MNLTNDDVQEILRLLDASSFDELQLSTDRFKLTLRRSGASGGGWTQEMHTAAAAQPSAAGTAGARALAGAASVTAGSASATPARIDQSARTHAPARKAAATVSAEGLIDIYPPIIGTFYRAPQPGAPPFVEVGSKVDKDTVIGIVETMKLMNSVYAGTPGVIVEICAANGHLVEQDHVLMRLQAS
jgi:acetyl-CoA carboxylase biotin carboxyl carrier protein